MASTARDFGRDEQAAVGRRIYLRRRELGLTQVELIRRLAISGLTLTEGGLSGIERHGLDIGKMGPVFAQALECTPSYLAGWTDNPKGWEPDQSLAAIVEQLAESVRRIRCSRKRPDHLRLLPSLTR